MIKNKSMSNFVCSETYINNYNITVSYKQMNSYNIDNVSNKEAKPLNNSRHQVDHPAENTRHQFEQLLTCHICFCHANNPMMCPYCSKLYCEGCIKRCLYHKAQCPHCRKATKTMASCNRFVNELITIVNELIDQKVQQQICKQHDVQINYFCEECSMPVCCECQMFGSHQGHSLKRLATIYQARYDALREMLSEFKTKLKQKQMTLKEVENQLAELKKIKEKSLKQLEEFTEHYRVKIIQQTTKQTNQIQQSVNKYNEIIANLNKLQEQLNVKAEEAQKSGTFVLDEELVKRIQNQLKVQLPRIDPKPKSVLEEVIPPFFESRFVISNFSKKKKDRSTIFSPTEKCQGSEWRLKIYPNGNESCEGSYLSIFIEMVSTIHQSTVYQYQIQLVNRKNPHQSMMRQSQSNFEPGQSWGYNKYIKLDNLMREGFIDPVTDQVQIRYFIRNPFYYNIYKQKQAYIQHLDNQILQQENQIKELELLLQGHQQQP